MSVLYEFYLRQQENGIRLSRRAASRYQQLQALQSRPSDRQERRPALLRRLVRALS